MKVLKKLQQKGNFLALLAERTEAGILLSASFAAVGCMREAVTVRSILKVDSKFKCHTCANEHTDIADDCPGI